MIIDVHTHPPQYKDAVPDDQVQYIQINADYFKK